MQGEWGKQGPVSQTKDSLLGCPLAQSPIPFLQPPSASIYPLSLPLFPSVCPPTDQGLCSRALFQACGLSCLPRLLTLGRVLLLVLPVSHVLSCVRPRCTPVGPKLVSFFPGSSTFPSFYTEIKHLQPTPESVLVKAWMCSGLE